MLLAACAESPRNPLPPSASDLTLLTTAHPCDRKDTFLQRHPLSSLKRTVWGSGEELQIPVSQSTHGAEESYFFDEDGLMVGAVFIFRNGLSLKPYPVLRRTIAQLKPDTEFYLSGASLADHENLNSGTLFLTGDEKSTTQYVISGEGSSQTLVIASFSIDPYVSLLSPYPEFVSRLGGQAKDGLIVGKKKDAKEPFLSLQQFARGQTAQLGYCDSKEYEKAAEAYRKALSLGFTENVWIAEAHHRLGVALEGQGQLSQAREEMEESLVVRPNIPEVLNNLGTVYMKLKQRDKAVKVLEKAVLLRPNYPLARYNLAESYEETNTKRAIGEYETYLALVEGIPEEAERMAQVKERIKALRR